ncbi:MAG: riboflavin synthase [Candidatus Binatus sp.]
MFTGIIEDLGTVESLKPTDQGAVISVHTSLPISEINIGDSITVNGACLTVISKNAGSRFAMDVSAETLRCTSLSVLKPGSRVNLERCLTLGKLLGGHLVSGHVDGIGRVVSIKPEGDSKLFTFEVAPAQARYLVEKGSVAIDGISLTIFSINDCNFSVELIPHTLRSTTLGFKQPADTVNIENDMLVKYVEKILAGRATAESA